MGKIVALAEAEERHLGKLTGKSQSELNAAFEKLDELDAHRHNYVDKASGIDKIDSSHWQDYQNFLSRLDNAVRSQQQIVKDCEQNLELLRRRWMARRQRLESLEHVLERYQLEETTHANRLEQRSLDDIPPRPNPYLDDDS